MINKNYLKLIRSKKKFKDNNFIYNIIAKRIIDSLDLLNISFNEVLELGTNDELISNFVQKKFSDAKITHVDFFHQYQRKNNHFYYNINEDNIFFKENYFDLIFSNLFLYLSNDIDKDLKKIFKSLKPNGFLITTIPNINNIFQLVNCMYETDNYYYNGSYNRHNPTFTIDKLLSSLKKNNFDNPSINSDNINISYSEFKKLLYELKSMNLSSCLKDKKQNFENKNYFNMLENIYKKKYYNNGFMLDININIISAWKK